VLLLSVACLVFMGLAAGIKTEADDDSVCDCFRTNDDNNVVIPPVPEEVGLVVNGEQSDDEEEVPPSDDEEQEDSKDYCIGEY